jgi:hypothetical protein
MMDFAIAIANCIYIQYTYFIQCASNSFRTIFQVELLGVVSAILAGAPVDFSSVRGARVYTAKLQYWAADEKSADEVKVMDSVLNILQHHTLLAELSSLPADHKWQLTWTHKCRGLTDAFEQCAQCVETSLAPLKHIFGSKATSLVDWIRNFNDLYVAKKKMFMGEAVIEVEAALAKLNDKLGSFTVEAPRKIADALKAVDTQAKDILSKLEPSMKEADILETFECIKSLEQARVRAKSITVAWGVSDLVKRATLMDPVKGRATRDSLRVLHASCIAEKENEFISDTLHAAVQKVLDFKEDEGQGEASVPAERKHGGTAGGVSKKRA